MISYKVLIILTYIIDISHCTLTETSYGKATRESNICQDNLKLVGFIYSRAFINYNLAKEIESKSSKHGGPKSENEIINSLIISRRTEDKLNDQKNKLGESELGEDAIRKYIHKYYNEIIVYQPQHRAMDPTEFCRDEYSISLCLPFWGNKRVASCVEDILYSFSDNPYSNLVKAFAMDNRLENTSPFAIFHGFHSNSNSDKYLSYLNNASRENHAFMADYSVKDWCDKNILPLIRNRQ